MEYMSVREASEKWGISVRRVQVLCSSGRVPGSIRLGRVTAVPRDTEKPADGRCRIKRAENNDIHPLQSFFGNEALFFQIVERFPFPVQVFAPDGTVVMTNDAFVQVFRIPGREAVNGKYNILQDPDIGKWGIREEVLRAFNGETVRINDIKVPVPDLVKKVCGQDLAFESIYQNIFVFPIHDGGRLCNVVAVFVTSRLYHGREEIMKSKEYLESRWLEEFDINQVAAAVSLSKYHLARLFKEHTGMTPREYYQDIKISRLREKLCDVNLSVSQAFAACGVDYNGNYARLFREKVGMTPSQYQASVKRK